MRYSQVLWGFASGFALAALVGWAFIVPAERSRIAVDTDSDVYRGVQIAITSIEQSVAAGEVERAKLQLERFNRRFGEFREGGPPPADWAYEVAHANVTSP